MSIFSRISFKLFCKKVLIVDIDKENSCFYYSIVSIFRNNFELLLNDVAKINNKASFKKNLIKLFFRVESINKFKVQGVYFVYRAEGNMDIHKFTYNDFAKDDLKHKDLYKFMLHSIPKNVVPTQSHHYFNYLNKNQHGFKNFSLDIDVVLKDKKYIMEIKKACSFCDIKLLGLMNDLFIAGAAFNEKSEKKKQNLLVINISRHSLSYATFDNERIKEISVQKEIGYSRVIEDMAKEFALDKKLSEEIFIKVFKNFSKDKNNSSVLKIVDHLGDRELALNKVQQVLLKSFNKLSKEIVELCLHNMNTGSVEKINYIIPEKYDIGYQDSLGQKFQLPVSNIQANYKNSCGISYSFNSTLVVNALQYIMLRKGTDVAMKGMKI